MKASIVRSDWPADASKPPTFAWLSKGFSAFLAAGGALPLERCLGLPRNDCALRRACRDYWLRRAWQALDDDLSPWRRSEKLAAVVRKFRMGRWVQWRTLEDAPILANEVELAVFEAFRSSERVPRAQCNCTTSPTIGDIRRIAASKQTPVRIRVPGSAMRARMKALRPARSPSKHSNGSRRGFCFVHTW